MGKQRRKFEMGLPPADFGLSAVVAGHASGRLSVDHRYQGQGIGEFLLIDALRRAYFQSSQIAAVAVVVDAIDEKAWRFYRHFGFIPLPDRPDRLFLPMKTIAALFGRP